MSLLRAGGNGNDALRGKSVARSRGSSTRRDRSNARGSSDNRDTAGSGSGSLLRVGGNGDSGLGGQGVARSGAGGRAVVGAVTAGDDRGGGGSSAARHGDVGRSREAGGRARARAGTTDDQNAVEVNTSQPAEQGQTDVDINVNVSSTTKDGGKLSTGVKGEREKALTTGEDSENTTQDGRQELVDSVENERQQVANQTTAANVNAHVNVNTDREVEQNNRLELNTESAVRSRDPLSKSVTGARAERVGGLAVGNGLESSLNIRLKLATKLRLDESSETSLGAAGQHTLLVNAGTDVSTNGDGSQTTRGNVANRNNTLSGLALDPGQNSGLEGSFQGALGAVEPTLESGLDIRGHAVDKTTTSSQVQTSLDVASKSRATGSLQEGRELVLQRRVEDDLGLNVGGTEDTVEGDEKTTLGGDVSGRRAQDGQTSGDVDRQQAIVAARTPVEQGRAQLSIDVSTSVRAQPSGQLLAGLGVNGTSLNTHGTSLEGSGSVCVDAVEQVGRALAATTEEATKETTQVDVQVNVKVDAETSTAVHDLVGRVGEGCARQPGEHEHVGTHFACGEKRRFRAKSVNRFVWLCLCAFSERVSDPNGIQKGILSRKKERKKADDCKQPKVI